MNGVQESLEDGVLTVAFDRPAKKNAITAAMYEELRSIFSKQACDPRVRAVLLTGRGGDFTSGNDVSLFVQDGDVYRPSPARGFMHALLALGKPVIAGVRGYAVGIGATVLIHCDYVVAGDDVKIRFPFVDLGLCPEFGSTLMLRELVGRRRADEWLTLCTPVGAEVALTSGLINKVVPAEAVQEEARKVARLYVAKPAAALAATRAMVRAGHSSTSRERMVMESEQLEILRRSPEAQAIFRRFLAKTAADRS